MFYSLLVVRSFFSPQLHILENWWYIQWYSRTLNVAKGALLKTHFRYLDYLWNVEHKAVKCKILIFPLSSFEYPLTRKRIMQDSVWDFYLPKVNFFLPPKETYGLWKEWSIWNKNTLWKWWKMSVKIKMVSVSSFFSIETEFCRVWCLHIMTYYTKTQHNHTQIRTILFRCLVCLICYHRCISEISDPYFKKLKN